MILADDRRRLPRRAAWCGAASLMICAATLLAASLIR
jgi:hypothetical protein